MDSQSFGRFNSDVSRVYCQRAAGPYFDSLARSFDDALSHLNHPEPQARLGALFFFRYYWKPPADFAEICETLAFEDVDGEVRCAALTTLISDYYCDSHDCRIGRQLAEVVRDETKPSINRYVAYVGLIGLTGWTGQTPDWRTFRMPDDVVWEFVESFLRNSESS